MNLVLNKYFNCSSNIENLQKRFKKTFGEWKIDINYSRGNSELDCIACNGQEIITKQEKNISGVLFVGYSLWSDCNDDIYLYDAQNNWVKYNCHFSNGYYPMSKKAHMYMMEERNYFMESSKIFSKGKRENKPFYLYYDILELEDFSLRKIKLPENDLINIMVISIF